MSLLTDFTPQQIWPLLAAIPPLAASVILFVNRRSFAALLLLFTGGLFLGLFMARLDPFLWLWDEQYHALVAKNLMTRPFTPMLFANPVIIAEGTDWTSAHIWMHKQPLFLWMMALSMKIAGSTEFAARYPSAILHALTAVMVYRMGLLIFNKNAGFMGAIFFLCAHYPLQLVSGIYSTDHNDTAFVFFVTASFWSLTEDRHSGKTIFLIFTGLFSGSAVLVKWLAGLLVFGSWGTALLTSSSFRFRRLWPMLLALLIAFIVFVPWQISAYSRFPDVYLHEMALLRGHFNSVIEGHGGDFFFHFRAISDIYGSADFIPLLLILAMLTAAVRIRQRFHAVMLFSAFAFVYLVYSAAMTKMTAFTAVLSPLMFLFIGVLAAQVYSYAVRVFRLPGKITNTLFILLVLGLSLSFMNLGRIRDSHTMHKPHDNHARAERLAEREWFRMLEQIPDKHDAVIFNTAKHANIRMMFHNGITAYDFMPDASQTETLSDKRVYVVQGDSLIVRVSG